MTLRSTPTRTPSRGRRLAFHGLAPLSLALIAGSVGCYRATGESRPTTVAEQIPATGGDRVAGIKATAGPGDYYLGNDYIQMAVDGAPYGQAKGQFGAPSGGAILDIGGVALDTAYNRVSLPTDNLESLAPVVNQDPDLRLVFDKYSSASTTSLVTLTMHGYLLDPLHKLTGATWDSDGRVQGVTVVHSISLGAKETDFTLNTKLINNSGVALPIQSLGDYLHQSGGGFRVVIPANQDINGNPLSSWGIDIPGSDFSMPLMSSVRASMVGLQGAEPSADDLDSHQSLGILPLDQDQLIVASDAQQTLAEQRPVFPSRVVMGSLPTNPNLGSGNSLSYSRRLNVTNGSSLSSAFPSEAEGNLNALEVERSKLRGTSYGRVAFSTGGTAAFKGYRQTEIRFERYIGDTTILDPVTDSNSAHWSLERLVSLGAGEGPIGAGLQSQVLLPAIPDPAYPGRYLPYRVIARDRDMQTVSQEVRVRTSNGAILPLALLRPDPASPQSLATPLAADNSIFASPNGNALSPVVINQAFAVRKSGDEGTNKAFTPARLIFLGLDPFGNPSTPLDPDAQRLRYFGGIFNPISKTKQITGRYTGAYQFIQGNELFGSNLLSGWAPASYSLPLGSYQVLFTSGPLNPISTLRILADSASPQGLKEIPIASLAIPSGWSTMDVPGPSQITTGGMIPAEQLSSALANAIDVVGRTDTDEFTDAIALRKSFRSEFINSGSTTTDATRTAVIGGDPFVINARSSNLGEGTFTTLFAPSPNRMLPFGGALPSSGWTAADFVGQAGGSYIIANRPRGPQGLFTSHPVAAGVPLGTGANSWWDDTDALANGHRTGDFNAIELLRAEGCNPADPSAWFTEFKAVRGDWFNLLNLETPQAFTKALGLSSGVFSLDTPVGLSRTYLKVTKSSLNQEDLSPVKTALMSGAAVASTGPLVDVTVGTQGPGELLTGTFSSVNLTANLWFATWVPVDEVRVVVNGTVVQTLPLSSFTQDPADARHWSATIPVNVSAATAGKDGWIVVEAGVPLATSGAYAPNTPWNRVMKGIYPIAVTNPIFVDVDGGGYTPPL